MEGQRRRSCLPAWESRGRISKNENRLLYQAAGAISGSRSQAASSKKPLLGFIPFLE
jgi:hypothetical protein